MKHLYGIWIVFLVVSQVGVNGTINVYNIMNNVVAAISNRDATINDGSTSIAGYVEYAKPPDACTHIAIPKFKPTSARRNIVLINGTSECDFMTKIRYAKEVGYEGAVLFDPFPGSFKYSNMTFPLPRSEINISVVLVSCEDGIYIQKNFLYPQSSDWQNVYVVIYPSIWTTDMIYFFLVIGLFVAGLVCVVLVAIFKIIIEKFRNRFGIQNEVEDNVAPNVERTLAIYENEVNSRSALRKRHPSIVFALGDLFEVCTICLSNFKLGDRLRVLGCSHAYHADCIDAWLLHKGRKLTCPLCVDNVNLENSCEQPHCNASESTPLLAFTHGQYSSARSGDNVGPSSTLGAVHDNLHRSTGESSNLVVGAQGSVNSMHLQESGNEDTQTLIV